MAIDTDALSGSISGTRARLEHMLVGAALLDGEYVRRACGGRSPRMFKDRQCREFWADLLDHGNAKQALLDNKLYTKALEWAKDVAAAMDAPEIAVRLDDQIWMDEEVSARLEGLAAAVTSGDANAAEAIVKAMNNRSVGRQETVHDIEQVNEALVAMIRSGSKTVLSKLGVVNRAIGGFERGTQLMVAARPAMGKTALGGEFGLGVAELGGTALFFSIEMGEADWWARLCCGKVGLRWKQVKAKRITKQQEADLIEACYCETERYKGRFKLDDKPQTVDTIWRKVMAVRPDVVIIDHISLVSDRERGQSETLRLDEITRRTKELAKAGDCCVIPLVQLNRAVEGRDNKIPTLADLRDSGGLEQNADTVLCLYRPSYYQDGGPKVELDDMQAWVRKDRSGDAVGKPINMKYHLPTQRFYSIDKEANERWEE